MKNVTVAGIEPLFLDDSGARALIIGGVITWTIAELCVVARNWGGENNFGRSETAIGTFWMLGLGLGDDYLEYAGETRRLIPGVW